MVYDVVNFFRKNHLYDSLTFDLEETLYLTLHDNLDNFEKYKNKQQYN